jgi:8-oxo-dGTP diphosphatase
MPFTYDFPRPAVTVDLAVFAATAKGPRILLIRRARDPHAGRWALPGGFLELDEELADAARREAREETGLDFDDLVEVGVFGAVGRDPRGRTLSVAFAAVQVGEPPDPSAGDDAREARWHPLGRLPKLAFDHGLIVRRARLCLARLAADGELQAMMPQHFTLAELRAVHEIALGDPEAANRYIARLRRAGAIRPTRERRGRQLLFRAGADR